MDIQLPPMLCERIADWYETAARPLPWRVDKTPYAVWISEVMLQQTRVEAVVPYYERFIRALPNCASLAAVDEDTLMKLWQGLGYYSRARNLQKAAQCVMHDFGGQLPDTYDELRRLPGIGDYTAGAIASISFGLPCPAVDGNVLRIAARLTACDKDVKDPQMKNDVRSALCEIYPSGKAASATTAGLMELGQTVCTVGSPKCERCVLNDLCAARRMGITDRLPVRAKAKARRVEELTVLVAVCDGRYALRKRPAGLLGKLWEYPNVSGRLDADGAIEAAKSLGLNAYKAEALGSATHIFTHIEWHMTGYLIDCHGESGAFTFASSDELAEKYALPSAFDHFTKQLPRYVMEKRLWKT